MDMAEGNVEIVHHGTDMARKGNGKGRVMDMGGGLYMREGSNIYISTVVDRAMLIQTQFYDGKGYCKSHGKGELLNHDSMDLAGTPLCDGSGKPPKKQPKKSLMHHSIIRD